MTLTCHPRLQSNHRQTLMQKSSLFEPGLSLTNMAVFRSKVAGGNVMPAAES
jgi:hypothetical protein